MNNEIEKSFYSEISTILFSARQKAYTAINHSMIEAYWKIGRRIVEEEQNGKDRAIYGAFIIKELAKHLTNEFGKGFSIANLANFRQFYLTIPSEEKIYALRRELSWTHLRLIMRVENENAKEYYMRETSEQNWSTRQLERNINSLYYERLLSTKVKGKEPSKEIQFEKQSTSDFIKDPYILEFLDLPEDASFSEKEMETAIISKLQVKYS